MAFHAQISNAASQRLVVATTFVLGAAALVLTFAPAEVAGWVGAPAAAMTTLMLQLYGAALFGLAMTGWMVRGAIVGGVFGRSYVVGNACHAFVGALALGRPALAGGAPTVLHVVAGVYWLLALTFGYLMFVSSPRS